MAHKLVPLTLEQHQQVLYEILYMVDDFCKAHDIPYFLVGGTLLGAVRHQGIIPWDDDADIAMTRENYERFLELFHAEGIEGYELFDYKHKEGFLYPFAMMTRTDTWTSIWHTHRITVDVFAYDGCGDDLQSAQKYFLKNRNNVSRLLGPYLFRHEFKHYNWKGLLVYLFWFFPQELFRHYPLWILQHDRKSYLNKMYSRYAGDMNIKEVKYCANVVWGTYGKGEVQPSSSFLNLDTMPFGTRLLPVPSGWDAYLTGLYGDYMTEEPENKRHHHLKEGSFLVV